MKHRKSGVISKIVPTLLLSSALAFGQVKDKPVVQKPSLEEKIIFDIGSVAQNVIGGYNDYYQIKDRRLFAKGDPNYKKYSELWHYSTALNIGAAISLGAFSGYKNEDNWEEYLKDVLTYSAIRWVVKDGVYNSLNGDPFFHQSSGTTSKLEPLGKWYVKLGFLAASLLYKYWDDIFGD